MNDSVNIYYLFSTAAQSIAAFIGLLIAGYALVLSMMDASAREDETLKELYVELRRQFHQKLTALSIVTAVAIIGCFIVLLLNKYDLGWLPYVAATVFLMACASIAGGVWFVITIIDPAKYKTVAKQLARDVEPVSQTSASVPGRAFLELVTEIEQVVRRLWLDKTEGQRLGNRPSAPSFREMVDVLHSHGAVAQDLYDQLVSVSKHRNVVVHGLVDFVNPNVFQEAEAVKARLLELDGDEGLAA